MAIQLRTILLTAVLAVASTHCASEADDESSSDPTEAAGSSATDDKVPVPSENVPGNLKITSPARAAFVEQSDAPIQITGTGATSSLTINGAAATVAADGTFNATLQAKPGLNMIVAVDGSSRLETPFLYGHFVSPTTPVEQAIAVGMNEAGLNAGLPNVSLTGIVNEALKGRDFLSALRGKSLSGKSGPASWTFKVTAATYSGITVKLDPRKGGLDVAATVADTKVTGTLSLKLPLGVNASKSITLSATRATVTGATNLSVAKDTGQLRAEMPTATTKLEGFKFDSNNAGLPCCVDDIATKYLRSMIEDALQKGVSEHAPKAIGLTLQALGLPKSIAIPGLKRPVAIATRFDGGAFEEDGLMISASALFGGAFNKGEPGEIAPGWLKLGTPLTLKAPSMPIATSVAVDSVNQILFTVWGQGVLARSVEIGPLGAAKFTAELPPLLEVTKEGYARVVLSEIGVDAGKAGGPQLKGAMTVTQEVAPSISGNDLVFAIKGTPTVSLTWLHDDGSRSANLSLMLSAAGKGILDKVLGPLKVPLPRAPLGAAGPSLAGKSLGLSEGKLSFDPAASRLDVAGKLMIAK
jgi:hypothetical protein